MIRRKPRQRRAAATVDAVLAAAAHVAARDGFDRFSTAAVAEHAGISIGSLYQYFGNKDDLLVTLARSELEALLSAIGVAFTTAAPGTRVRAVIHALVAGLAGTFTGAKPELLLRLGGQPVLKADIAAFVAQFGTGIADVGRLSPEGAFVLTRAVLGVATSFAIEPQVLDPACIEEELVTLAEAYLRRPETNVRALHAEPQPEAGILPSGDLA